MAATPAGALSVTIIIYSDSELLFAIQAVKTADSIGESEGLSGVDSVTNCPKAKLYAVYRKKFDFDQKYYKTQDPMARSKRTCTALQNGQHTTGVRSAN